MGTVAKSVKLEFSTIDSANFPSVAKIYREGIDTGNATFEIKVPSFAEWDTKHLPFGRLVALDNDKIVGWASLSKTSDRCVYKGVAEVSVYVGKLARGQGIGKQLLQELINISESEGIWTLQCGIMRENTASILLHKKCGFREIGYRERIGQLNGVWRDNIIMERRSSVVGI